ncbi:MAG: hypothetical protein H6817_06940 [Phycisphaerales bacterium]|nr:hypothetical protein [Phycisphaerales bacterium]
MPERTRMIRVWMSLVVAMSGGAMLLSWLEHSPTPLPPPISLEKLQARADQVVSTHDRGLRAWGGVKLVDVSRATDRLALVATRPQDDVHFVLSTTGDMVVMEPWRAQEFVSDDGCIRIGIESATTSGIASVSQLRGLQALLDALSKEVAQGGQPATLAIRLEDAPQRRAIAQAIERQLTQLADNPRV